MAIKYVNPQQISSLIACPACDLVYENISIDYSQNSYCSRCGTLLNSPKKNSIINTLAFSIAGLILFFPAILLPIMTLKVLGETQQSTLLSTPYMLFKHDMKIIAILVFLFSVLIPFAKLVLIFITSLSLQLEKISPVTAILFRWYQIIDEWGMIEVYMLGILVAYIKLVDMAEVILGSGLYMFSALLVVVSLLSSFMDDRLFWSKLDVAKHDSAFK